MSSLQRDAKRALRVAVLAKRKALPSARAQVWGGRIQRRALNLPAYLAAVGVALYSPLGGEVDTSGIRRHALEARKRLYYPATGGTAPGVVRIRSERELVPGRYGILEPVGDEGLSRAGEDALAVFVPGVAFDLNGNRLGRGGGWYDRWLGGLGGRVPRIALAYEFQLLEDVPVEPGDQPVHTIVTEERVIACDADASPHHAAEPRI